MDLSDATLCYIGVGGNIDPENNIPAALDMLHRQCPILGVSTFYRTPAIDRPDQPDYLNGAVAVWYPGHPRVLKFEVLRPIEAALGRIRTQDAYAARPVDLDVVLCGAWVLNEPGLVIPDPDIRERVFLAAALFDLDPELILPDTGMALKTHLEEAGRCSLNPDGPFTRALKERFL